MRASRLSTTEALSFCLFSQLAISIGKTRKKRVFPPAQARRRGTAPPMAATRARSPGAAGRPGPPPVAPVWVLAVSRRSSLKAQANGSKFNLLLMLVAQMSTYPRAIATHYCSWGSRNFKLTHGALTAFEDLGVVAVAVPRRARRCFSARLRRPPTRHRNCGRFSCQSATR